MLGFTIAHIFSHLKHNAGIYSDALYEALLWFISASIRAETNKLTSNSYMTFLWCKCAIFMTKSYVKTKNHIKIFVCLFTDIHHALIWMSWCSELNPTFLKPKWVSLKYGQLVKITSHWNGTHTLLGASQTKDLSNDCWSTFL